MENEYRSIMKKLEIFGVLTEIRHPKLENIEETRDLR